MLRPNVPCAVCGKLFDPNGRGGPRVACSPECKAENTRRKMRAYSRRQTQLQQAARQSWPQRTTARIDGELVELERVVPLPPKPPAPKKQAESAARRSVILHYVPGV